MHSSARYRYVIANQEEEARRDQDIETLTGELDLREISEAASGSSGSGAKEGER